MSDPQLPGDRRRPRVSLSRIAIWVFVGGIGLYLVISGMVGIIVKGQ